MTSAFKKTHRNVLAGLSIFFLIIVTAFAGIAIYRVKASLNSSFSQINIHTASIFQAELERIISVYQSIIKDTLENQKVIELIKAQDKDGLYHELLPRYKFLKKENPYLVVMHFHTPETKTLLRMHNPKKYGDDLYAKRPIIRDVNRRLVKANGFESGVHGFFYRIVSPIIFEGKHYGALEIGIDTNFFAELIHKFSPGMEFAALVQENEVGVFNKKNEMKKFGEYYFYDQSNIFETILPMANADEKFSIGTANHRDYLLITGLLLNNYKGQVAAKIVVAKDITNNIKGHTLDIIFVIAVSAVSLFFSIIMLNGAFKKYQTDMFTINEELASIYEIFNRGEIAVFKWKDPYCTKTVFASDNINKITGHAKELFEQGKVFYSDLIYKKDFDRFINELEASKNSKQKETLHEPYRISTKNGETKWIMHITRTYNLGDASEFIYLAYITDITHLIKTQNELKETQERLKLAIEGSQDGLWDWDLTKRNIYFSRKWQEISGISIEKKQGTFDIWESIVFEKDYVKFSQVFDSVFSGGKDFIELEYRIKTPLNRSKWVSLKGKAVRDSKGNVVRILGFQSDIDVQKKLEREQKNFLNIIDKNILVFSTDKNLRVSECSSALIDYLNLDDDVKGEEVFASILQLKDDIMPEWIKKSVDKDGTWSGEAAVIGEPERWVNINITADNIIGDKMGGYTIFIADITDKKKIEEMSVTDGLTGLYNRRFFNSVFGTEIRRARRENEHLAFLILDIDNFKQYNDTYGHPAGDRVLESIGNVLKESLLRASDYSIRLGGEEFALLFYGQSFEKSEAFAEVLRQRIEGLQIEHSRSTVSEFVTASFGLAVYRGEEIPDEIIFYNAADSALYEAKDAGKNRVVITSKTDA